MTRRYVPKRGDEKTGLAIVCPVTTKIKGYPFEVPLKVAKRESAILADHVKNVDWVARRAQYISAAPPAVLLRVAPVVSALVSTP